MDAYLSRAVRPHTMPDYRSVPDDRGVEFVRTTSYAFDLEGGPRDDDGLAERADSDAASLGERRALFDGDDLLVVCAHHPLSMRVRGEFRAVGGVSAVASRPEHRRRGLVRDLIAESLREYRDRGWQYATLWPFKRSFYRRLGWGAASRHAKVELPPDALSFAADARDGAFRRVDGDDWAALDRVHRETYRDWDLALDRSEEWWRHHVLESWRDDPYAYLLERGGEPAGYVVYYVHDGDDGSRMAVADLGYVDRDAYRECLRFCYDHDSQVESVVLHGPVDLSLLDRVDDPSAVEYEVTTGAMLRLVDVPAAFEALSYRDAPDGDLLLAVSDSLADWNDATFRLSIQGDTADCTRADADPGDADVETGVATLSQVHAGYFGVGEATDLGDLTVQDRDAADLLAAALPERDTYVTDGF